LPPGHTLINFQFLNNQTPAVLLILFFSKTQALLIFKKLKDTIEFGKPICNPASVIYLFIYIYIFFIFYKFNFTGAEFSHLVTEKKGGWLANPTVKGCRD
jgi:hypothetical protein